MKYIARYEKVSENQFKNDLKSLMNLEEDCYNDIIIPKRATSGSAGYDFYSPIDVVVNPNEFVRIPTGIRCYMEKEYVLHLYPRSSLGFKYQMGLVNTTGVIDSDYYNADNEGHIIVGVVNRGNKPMEIKKGDRFVQGVFVQYYLAFEEENNEERHGGFGSTN